MDNILYINESTIEKTGLLKGESLNEVWDLLVEGLIAFGTGNAHLPLDAYLRSPKEEQFNRIIAKMGIVKEVSGIKWIASAPLNTKKGLPRASGILVLNDIVTGRVYAILDAVPISNVRTAGCSMLFLKYFRPDFKRAVIFGTGVHGREHLGQLLAGQKYGAFPNLGEICIFDMNVDYAKKMQSEYDIDLKIIEKVADCFQDDTAVIFCTNALVPHLDESYTQGRKNLTSVHMSLRDYTAKGLVAFDHVVADSAVHVAKAKTSVDLAVTNGLLTIEDCFELPHLLIDQRAGKPNPFAEGSNVVFNPMGLGSHDLILGNHVYQQVKEAQEGILLPV